jgi:DDE family transposase
VRLDGAGFSHDLLEHIAAGGDVKGRQWEFSVGWSCPEKEMDAIQTLPADAWTPGIDQNGDLIDDPFVADLTGLFDLGTWHHKIPGLRIIVRDEPLHPRYRKRATEREKQLGRRYQLIATNTKVGQVAWLDARHRSHVHVENDVKQAKDLGLNRWPSRRWAINVAWTQVVALAANLLACFRHLTLPEGELRDAAPKTLRYRLWHLPARLTRGQRKRWLHLRADWPWTDDVINTWRAVTAPTAPTRPPPRHPDDHGRTTARSVEPGAPDATVGPRPHPRTGNHDQNDKAAGAAGKGKRPPPGEKSRPARAHHRLPPPRHSNANPPIRKAHAVSPGNSQANR